MLAQGRGRWAVIDSCLSKRSNLRSRRLEVVGTKKKRARKKETREGRGTPRVSPSRAPVLSFAHYFQAPATQAKKEEKRSDRKPRVSEREMSSTFLI